MVTNNRENLGPAERIIQSVLAYTDHLYHGRPGMVTVDARQNVDVRWEPVTHKVEERQMKMFELYVGETDALTEVEQSEVMPALEPEQRRERAHW
jgi:hypothetical protein